MPPRIITVSLPEYTLDSEPDYAALGPRVDAAIARHLPDGEYVYRALGQDDHPQFSLDELVALILRLGTDRYDPARRGVAHEEFAPYDYDLQAGSFTLRAGRLRDPDADSSLFGDTMRNFYVKTLYDRGYRVRVDLLTIYHADHLERAPKRDPEAPGVAPHLESYLYRFKDRSRRAAALAAVVKVLR